MPHPRPRILFVCHGNVARSPAAEFLARNRFPDLGWEFASGGIGALVGQGVANTVAADLRARGVETGRHRARQLERRMLHGSTLVLTNAVEVPVPAHCGGESTVVQPTRVPRCNRPPTRSKWHSSPRTTKLATHSRSGSVPPPMPAG